MPDWSLEGELRKAARADNVESALRILNLLPINEQLATLSSGSDWVRGGAETYIFRFDVRTRSGLTIPAIIKAHTPAIGPRSIDESLSELLRRRQLLANGGIRTPSLYYAGNGIVIERYLPFSFVERFAEVPTQSADRFRLSTELVAIAIVLDEHGFAPIEIIGDLRVDESGDVFMIDFGEDLGPPNNRPNRLQNEQSVSSWLKQHDIQWSYEAIRNEAVELLRRRRNA